MPASYPQQGIAAGITAEDAFTPFNLFAGDTPAVVTDQAENGGAAIAQFVPVGVVTATGKLKAWDPASVDGSQVAIGVTAQPIAANTTGPVYKAGCFNHAALTWPAATDTLAERKAAFNGTMIVVKALI